VTPLGKRIRSDRAAARDLTQGFFAQWIQKQSVPRADPERGRFRSCLLGAFKHFLADDHDRAQARKRGGGLQRVSIDSGTDGAEQVSTSVDLRTPDHAYDERWAAALLERVLARLRQEFSDSGRGELFNLFKDFLAGRVVDGSYAAVATRVRVTVGYSHFSHR
jgi:RNA polymerase sigma-70 factor (ECF subfamily)